MANRRLKEPMVLPTLTAVATARALASFIVSEACGCYVLVGRRAATSRSMFVTANCGADHEDLGEEVHEAIEASTWVRRRAAGHPGPAPPRHLR